MSAKRIVSRNPATGAVLASLPETEASELSARFETARKAQEAWARVPLRERARRLITLRERLIDKSRDLAELLSRENGKPVFEAFSHEIVASLELLTYYAKNSERILRPRRIGMGLLQHRKSRIEYWPIGTTVVISPWNYPLLLPLGEIAPILTAGNSVIFKPSEVTPLAGLEIQKLFDEAGYPPGLLQTVIGDGKLGAALIDHRPGKVFFTGSVATGKKIMAQAANSLVPVNLELGGKDALIVLEDADLDHATSAALWGAYTNSGQICASVERLLVHESVAGPFKDLLAQKASKLRAGDPIDPSTDLGATTFEGQKQIYSRQLDQARAVGARFVFGGEFSEDRTRLAPTLIEVPRVGADASNLEALESESFGPLATFETFSSDDEAAALSNASRYGLLGSILTRDPDRARSLAARLEVGTVLINEVVYGPGIGQAPWGGIKESGIGRSHGEQGLLEAVHLKHIHEPRFWVGRLAAFKSPWWFPYSPLQKALFESLTELYRQSLWRKLRALPKLVYQAARLWIGEPRI